MKKPIPYGPWLMIVALVAGAALLWHYYPRPAAAPAVAVAVTGATPAAGEPAVAPAPPSYPIEQVPALPDAPTEPLPLLDDSDGLALAALSEAVGSDVGVWLRAEFLLPRFVATVDALPRKSLTQQIYVARPVAGALAVAQADSRLWLDDERKQPRVINEAKPYGCVRCGKAFGTLKGVEAMLGKLSGHAMFQGDALERLKADDRLRLMAGRVMAIRPEAGSVAVDWKPRHGPARPALAAAWLIDCTGPGHDPARDHLTGPLLASGRARMDGLRLGLDLDDEGRVIDAGGQADDRLFVLGPPARAAYWETIAVPDIRKRIEAVAGALQ
jgi:hypothetical protein